MVAEAKTKRWPAWDEPGLTVLQQVMRYQELSAQRLARGSGVPVSTVHRVIGGAIPTLENAIRMARYLKVRVEDLWSAEVE